MTRSLLHTLILFLGTLTVYAQPSFNIIEDLLILEEVEFVKRFPDEKSFFFIAKDKKTGHIGVSFTVSEGEYQAYINAVPCEYSIVENVFPNDNNFFKFKDPKKNSWKLWTYNDDDSNAISIYSRWDYLPYFFSEFVFLSNNNLPILKAKIEKSKNKDFSEKWKIVYLDKNEWDTNQLEIKTLHYEAFDKIIDTFGEQEPFIIVEKNNKKGILLNPFLFEASDFPRLEFNYDEIRKIKKDNQYFAIARNGKKWGLIDWKEGEVKIDFVFSKAEDVPLLNYSKWQFELFNIAKEKLNISDIKFDTYNEDGIVLLQNNDTKKWGMYQIWHDKKIDELIPPQYDSIKFFSFNGMFTGVYINGKVGIYTSPFSSDDARQTVPCIYDDYKTITVYKYPKDAIPNTYSNKIEYPYLAVKKNGLWAYVDWKTGEEKTDFIYDLEKEKMPFPRFHQDD
jgi:hypothetical protein